MDERHRPTDLRVAQRPEPARAGPAGVQPAADGLHDHDVGEPGDHRLGAGAVLAHLVGDHAEQHAQPAAVPAGAGLDEEDGRQQVQQVGRTRPLRLDHAADQPGRRSAALDAQHGVVLTEEVLG